MPSRSKQEAVPEAPVIAAPAPANAPLAARMRPKTLAEFDVAASSIPPATFDYLSSLEWIRAAENVCLIGPAGTGKSHTLIALGIAAVEQGHRVRYFTAAELVENLYRGLADNSVGKAIDTLLRNDLLLVDDIKPAADKFLDDLCLPGRVWDLSRKMYLGYHHHDSRSTSARCYGRAVCG